MRTFADGQLAATATALFTAGQDTNYPSEGNVLVSLSLTNTSGATTETVLITLLRSGSTARRLCRIVLEPNESAIVSGIALSQADALRGQTTNATTVDYVLHGSNSPVFYVQAFTATGVSKAAGGTNIANPSSNDGAALGSTSLQWSDLFLAEGGVINWDNGDVTITQTNNVLAVAGTTSTTFDGQVNPATNDAASLGTTTLGWADLHLATGGVINWANGEVTITETDANTLTIAGTATLIDIASGILELNNALRFDTGVAIVAASYSVGRDADVTNQLHFNIPTGATYEWSVNDVAEMLLSATELTPGANDGSALGSTTVGWADLHLATGGVINWANGEVTITETDGNTLTIAGTATLIDIASGIFELNNALRFDTGVAMVAASYSVGRDADATNQLHFNIPTGATFEWSVNDVAEMLLSATELTPGANDGSALGSTTVGWADLHLAAGGVINWANGEVTITETDANTLTIGGATVVSFGANTLNATGTRILQSYHTNITSTNAVTVDSSETVKRDISAYRGDALKTLEDMDVITFRHQEHLDKSGSLKLGIRAESVNESLALEQIQRDGEGSYPGVNLYSLAALMAKAIQQLAGEVRELKAQAA